MPVTLEVTIDDREVREMIDQLSNRVVQLSVPMNLAAEHMRHSVEQNFAVGGRPTRWPVSARAERESGQTLVDTSRLLKSITYSYDHSSIEIGTNVAYARAHQLGYAGIVMVRSHTRRVKSRDVRVRFEHEGRRKRKLIAKGIAFVRSHDRNMNIPARPFLVVQDEDIVEIKSIIKNYLMGFS